VQSVDGVGDVADGRVEPDGVIGAVNVVVDRLRNADERHAILLRKSVGEQQRAVAPNDD
jgi:hypothetical protein